MTRLVDGWFCDRATGAGKPVYSSGATVVPTNGLVGGGVSGAITAGTFTVASLTHAARSVLDGWFCDRAGGEGKPVYAMNGGTIVPTNGPVGGGTGATVPPVGAGGKYYFEVTVGLAGAAQVSGAQVGFINAAQRDTLPSDLLCLNWQGSHLDPNSGCPIGGRVIWQGRNVDGAVLVWNNNPQAWITGTGGASIAAGLWTTGDVIGYAVDTINNRFWARNWTQTAGGMTTGWVTGNGDPQTPTGGFDISLLTGNIMIWFGAPGRYTDSLTLNAGASQFYGLNGTHVIPTGYVAWDATGATTWDKPSADTTQIRGMYRAAGHSPADALLNISLSSNRLTATIHTNSTALDLVPPGDPLAIDDQYGSTWLTSAAYPAGGNKAVVLDGQSPNFPCSFYVTASSFSGGPSLNQPVGNNSWESVVIGVVSNSSKARV